MSLDAFPLTCPVCRDLLGRDGATLRCRNRHAFDIARQGYVNLTAGRPLTGDTAEMVAERDAFLAAGHYRPLAERLAAYAARLLPRRSGLIIDAGGGTGYYLARVLDRVPQARGLVIDSSVPAVRRAARAHPRAGAIAWDVRAPWPIPDGAVDLVLDVFAPRNAREFHRVLRPDGALLVVTPAPQHLAEVRTVARLLDVDARKLERLEGSLAPWFTLTEQDELTISLDLDERDVGRVVAMGPSAYHRDRGAPPVSLGGRDTLPVTASFVVTVHEPGNMGC
jgi:23S rRNA (guanine745-N1)-methyltransferase